MSWREALAKVLKAKALVPRCEGVEEGFVLREKKANMQRTIAGTPPEGAVLSVERVDHPPGVAEGGWRQRCDHLILAERNGIHHAVLIEMKRELRGEEKPFEQLFHTLPIVEYLSKIGRMEGVLTGRLHCHPIVLVERLSPLEKPPVKAAAPEPVRVVEHRDMRIPVFRHSRLRFDDLVAPCGSEAA